MAYMMTDLAAGSKAAEQFQQDIAEAPYVSDITQTGAERKLQENRLALQYAPEEAAAKAEKLQFLRDQERINALYAPAKAATQQAEDTYKLQEQMNVAQNAETERLFKEAGYKADTKSTEDFKTWMSSDDGKKASDIQRLEKAAQFKAEAGLPKQAADLYAQIENINTKETANKAKELKNANESLASARALIKNVPDEEVADYIKRLPDNLQKTITNRVGEDNWNKLDGKQKKALLETLFQDAKQQVDVQIKEIEAQKAIDAAKEVTKRSNYRADKQAEFKGKGNSGDSTKQEAKNFSDVMRVDERLAKESVRGLKDLDEKIVAAEKAKVAADAKSKNWFDKDVENERTAASTAVDQAKENKNKYVKQQLERRIKVLETAPTYPGKQAYIDSLKKELSLYGGDEPPPAKEDKVTPSAASTVPSNKYTQDNPAKPTSKAEYDALPSGSYYIQDGAIKQKSGGKAVEATPTSAATPAEPVMTDAEKQAKAAKNREKNLNVSTNKPVEPAVKNTSTDFTGAKSADLIREGNIDLTKRPVVKNKDGSISTVRSMSFEEDGMQILIPTVVGDKVVSDKAAIDHYRKTGEHLGMFSSVKAANAYAKKLHEEQDKMYSDKTDVEPAKKTSNVVTEPPPAPVVAPTVLKKGTGPLTPSFKGATSSDLLESPTINLKGSPFVTIGDKVVSPFTYEEEGTFILLPGVVNGKAVSGDAAFANYNKSKNKKGMGAHLGRFSSKEAATAYSYKLHEKDLRERETLSKELKELQKTNAKEKLKQLAAGG